MVPLSPPHTHTHTHAGISGIGDACEVDTDGDGIADAADTDGDGVTDDKDIAPRNKLIQRTSFIRHTTVSLTSPRQVNPRWKITANVRKLVQRV